MSVKWVVIESDRPITGSNPGNPVGIVSTEEKANAFYQKDPEHRDYIPFNEDELPELTGEAGSPLPASPPPPVDYSKLQKEVQEACRRTEETNQRMQQVLDRLNKKR